MFWLGGSIPWVSPKDMKVARIRETEDAITPAAVESSSTKLVPADSVLMVTRSGILAHSLPVAVTDVEVALNQDLKALVPAPGLRADYLCYALERHAEPIRRACTKHGTTVHSVEFPKLQAYEVPVAPRQEQGRITAALDSYFTRLDAAQSALERAQANLKRYRSSVLKAAVEGRLVPTEAELAKQEGREYEPASVLLERVLAERRRRWEEAELAKMKATGKVPAGDGWKKKYKEPVGPEVGDLPELPEGWCWALLPQLGELNRGKSKHRPRNDPRLLDGPYPFIQTGDVRKVEGFIEAFEQTYSEFGLAQSRLWPAGTLCITIAANIAETGILKFAACFPDSVVGFLNEEQPVLVRYLELFLRTAKQDLAAYAPATAQKNINLATLSDVAVPLPPDREQRRLIAEVDRVLSVCGSSEAAVRGTRERIQRLRQSILKWAFEGKLVDQDPNDEPASVLLERIREQRQAEGPKRRRAGRRKKV